MISFKEAEKILLSKHAVIKKNSMDFLYPIFDRLGRPQDKLGSVIHVTGTNGKGSVCAYMESALRACGFKTAVYTSPHIFSLRERIKFCGKEISETEFAGIFSRVYPLCKDLTFFEIMTVIAFVWFSQKKPDFSVIEVGIGGLYDTTNVIEKTEIAVISSIGYDHMELLGNSLEKIAVQKAGIAKKGSTLIYPAIASEAEIEVKKTARKAGAAVLKVRDIFEKSEIDVRKGLMNFYSSKAGRYQTRMIGEKQSINVSIALAALETLSLKHSGIDMKKAKKGIEKAFIPARFQILKKAGKRIIVDGCHNEEAVKVFISTIKKAGLKPKTLIFSIMANKDYKKVLRLLSKKFEKVYFSSADENKALSPAFLADEFEKYDSKADITAVSQPEIALKAALKDEGDICVCGSFYLASKILKLLGRVQ